MQLIEITEMLTVAQWNYKWGGKRLETAWHPRHSEYFEVDKGIFARLLLEKVAVVVLHSFNSPSAFKKCLFYDVEMQN